MLTKNNTPKKWLSHRTKNVFHCWRMMEMTMVLWSEEEKKTRKNKREKTRKTHHRQHRKWREASGFCFHVCLLGLTRKQKYLFSFISYGFLSLYILLIVDGYYIVLSCIQNLRHGHRYLRLSKEGVGILKLLKTLLWPSDGGNLLLVAVVNGYDIQ